MTLDPRAELKSNTRMEQSIRPYTEEVIASCPKFRILLTGKSGAGKSSLVNKIFGVELAVRSPRALERHDH